MEQNEVKQVPVDATIVGVSSTMGTFDSVDF